ncbi:MAG: phospholipid carrier-dependent glycosyltransferase, partial [Acidobacteriota bacterium]
METETTIAEPARSNLKRHALFFAIVIALIAAAIIRSSIATSLDSFTFDEAYHVGAGAAYIRTGDFRLNPEQPPLTKLWTGAYVTLLGYNLSPYRAFADKSDERDFVEIDAYSNNDPFVLQSRARSAMFTLNALLLFCFALAARHVFGDVVAIAVTLFLAIDPTVAAHMPVVMTDLPVALASGTAVLLAAKALQTWGAVDLLLTALAVGVALGAKHSGIITLVAVGIIGVFIAVVLARGANAVTRLKRTGAVTAVVIGGMIVLWSFYGFRFHESPGTSDDTFNRPMAEKISDVKSTFYRTGLDVMLTAHLFPRAYVWGLADTIRAGVEGRAIPILAFGEQYYAKAPFYFFPGIVAAKLPIGLLVLSIIGGILLIARRLPREYLAPFLVVSAFSAFFLFFLIRGSSYAGVRHALPLFPFAALLGAFALAWLTRSRILALQIGGALLIVAAIVSAVPQMRPWEYFNEFAGGAENGYLYFNDEGVDLSQRIGEVAEYYHRELEPNGEIPYLAYFSNSADRKARGMDWVGRDSTRDATKYDGETVTGTFIIGGNELGPKMWWDVGKSLRGTQPIARFGNIFIFRGTFETPKAALSRRLYNQALYDHIYVPQPDTQAGVAKLSRSVELDPTAFCASLELGNQYLKLGDRDGALRAYRISLENAPTTDSSHDLLSGQISRVETETLENIAPLRNPGIE